MAIDYVTAQQRIRQAARGSKRDLGMVMTSLLNSVAALQTVAPITELSYFAGDVATYAWYTVTQPNSIYDATNDKTIVGYERWNGSSREEAVKVLDHRTLRWSNAVPLFESSVTDDDHGVPALLKDHQGYYHGWGGAHGNPLRHASSNAPNDASSFTRRADIGAALDRYCYPTPHILGSTIYLFIRENRDTDEGMPTVLRRSTALNAGVATWGPEETILKHPTLGRCYFGTGTFTRGTDIWLSITGASYGDTERRDQWMVIYDTLTGNLRNMAGNRTVLAANLPLTLDDDFLTRAQTTLGVYGGNCAYEFDAADRLHMAWLEGSGSNVSTWNIMHEVYEAGAWSTPVILGTTESRYNGIALVKNGAAIELYYSKTSPSFPSARGGDIHRRVWTAGVWGADTILASSASSTFFLDVPVAVKGGHPDCRVLWSESYVDASNGSANTANGKILKAYGYGDKGLVGRSYVPATVSSVAITGTPQEGQVLTAVPVVGGEPAPTMAYAWKRGATTVGTSSTYTATSGDVGSTLTVAVTATNVAGTATATSPATATITAAVTTPAWVKVVNSKTPAYDFDFENGRYWGQVEGLMSITDALSVSRTSGSNDAPAKKADGTLQSFADNVLRITNKGLRHDVAGTNLFANPLAPVTQTVTVINGVTYVASVTGPGSVTLSGAITGTASEGSPSTATAASGTSLTVTVTGSPTHVQIENHAFATSPMIGTRSAELIDAKGAFLTALLANNLSFVLEASSPDNNQSFARYFTIGSTNATDYIWLGRSGAVSRLQVFVGNSANVSFSPAWANSTRVKLGISYTDPAGTPKANGSLNGIVQTEDTSYALPTRTKARFGLLTDGTGNGAESFIHRFTAWPIAMTAAEIQAATA